MNVEVKEMPELRVAYIRRKGAYGPEIGPLFEQLLSWAGPKGLCNESSMVMAFYWDNPEETAPEACRSDAAITVPAEVEADPEKGIEIQTIPAGKTAMHLCNVYNEDFETPWTEMMTRGLAQCQCQPDGSRPCAEIYYNCGCSNPLKKWVVDICVPVQ